jgi:serine/threonine protein phosphatase PrpC
MNVAISGDRGKCVTQPLGPQTYLFAIASGFGFVEGEPIASTVLERLKNDMQRRTRRTKNPKNLLTSAMGRVNEEVHARTASHEDYITAGCSATAVLLVENRAFLAHAGSTGAYLARDGYVVSLTKNDAFENEGALPVLTRALGVAPTVDVASCSFTLNDGDTLVLTGRRLREADERRRLAECLTYGADSVAGGEQMVIVRFQPEDRQQVSSPVESHSAHSVVVGVLATIVFYAMLCLR